MELIPKEIQDKIPPLYATEDLKDPTVHIKLFIEGWTWFVTELSIDKNICFGYIVSPFESELGYFSLKELASIRSSLGLGIERDFSFKPTPLSRLTITNKE